jgi:glutathione S-transferase
VITVHHLNFSRSSRILIVLEELDLKYRLVAYERDPAFRAPVSLSSVHPLGRAPVIQDGDLVLAESAVILTHINDRHGGGRLAPPIGSDDRARHDEWLHYAEGSAALPLIVSLMHKMLGGVSEGVLQYVQPELRKALGHLVKGIGQGPYLLGEKLSLADIQLSYLLDLGRGAHLLDEHPELVTYLNRLFARPAFVRALQIGGPMAPPR